MSQWYEEAEKEVGLAVDDDDDDNDNDDDDKDGDEDEMDHVRMKTCRSNAISLWTSQHSTAPPLRYSSSFKTFQSFQIPSKNQVFKSRTSQNFQPRKRSSRPQYEHVSLAFAGRPLEKNKEVDHEIIISHPNQ